MSKCQVVVVISKFETALEKNFNDKTKILRMKTANVKETETKQYILPMSL